MIRLQSNTDLQEIKDPDPLMNCDLLDGRDAFLTMSRDKHYEFSSLRRAKYSTAGMLHELHNQARDSFAYVCNACKASVETRYHCTTCEVCIRFSLCAFVVCIKLYSVLCDLWNLIIVLCIGHLCESCQQLCDCLEHVCSSNVVV